MAFVSRTPTGWDVDSPVQAEVFEHGRRLHNMKATREQVLAALDAPPVGDTLAG
jgi:hypothetical protein